MRLTVPLLRDVVMLALGSAGMTRELFFTDKLDMVRVSICIGLLLGPAALNSIWRRQQLSPPADTPTGGPPSLPRSSSRRRG